MAISIAQFEEFNPADWFSTMLVYIDISGPSIGAVNISNSDKNNVNIYESLSQLKSLIISFGGNEYNIVPSEATYKPGGLYWHFVLDPALDFTYVFPDTQYASSSAAEYTSDTDVPFTLEPGFFAPDPNEILFRRSEYEVLENNTEGDRTTSFIFKVDRSENSFAALNIETIVSGTADIADVLEYNYTSKGIINSRYNGAKTTKQEYGVVPALSAGSFKGGLFSTNTTDAAIVSQSSENKIEREDLLVVNNPGIEPSANYVLLSYANTSPYPKFREQFLASSIAPGSLGWSTGDVESINISGSWKIVEDDIINVFESLSVFEYARTGNGTYNKLTNLTTIPIKERDIGAPFDVGGTFTNTSNFLQVRKVVGDIVYAPEESKVFRVSEKKLYIEETKEIHYIDKTGVVIYTE